MFLCHVSKRNLHMGFSISQMLLKIGGIQLSLLLIAAGATWYFEPLWGKSLFIGGLIYLFPNAYFAFHASHYRGAQSVNSILHSLNKGELGKFLLTTMGFATVFALVKPLSYFAVFVGYIYLTVCQWHLVGRSMR